MSFFYTDPGHYKAHMNPEGTHKRLRHILQIIDNIFAVLDAPFRYPLRNITLEVGVKFVREVVID
jgi:hypothetical protein